MLHNRAAPRAFTLIELLVVVAIIALLISILLPALNGARAQAKQTICLTNMQNAAKAARIYAQENRDFLIQGDDRQPSGETTSHFVPGLLPGLGYPENLNTLFRRTPGQSFTEALHRVCVQVKSLQCPTFPEERQSLDYVVNAFPIPAVTRTWTISAQVGDRPENAPRNANPSLFFNYSKCGRANLSRTIYITEAHERMPLPPPDGQPWPNTTTWGELIDLFIPNHMPFALQPRVANDQRHPRGITAAFFDGHGEVLPLRQVDPAHPAELLDRIRRFTYDEAEPVQ
jgi:prepilin-type N-terminal cleavage/methylation domain-containing protein/prepilin-type processing-associated H-X9-DG protein